MDGNKRVGALVAIAFLNENDWDLEYPIDSNTDFNGLAKVIEECAAGNFSKDELMEWFDSHKVVLK